MGDITVLWNQTDSFPDLSEAWNPSEGDGFCSLRGEDRDGCLPKHVVLDGCIGYRIMSGLYYFGDESRQPEISISDIPYEGPAAILGRKSYSSEKKPNHYRVTYLAVDEESIKILKKIQRTVGDGSEKFKLIANDVFSEKEEMNIFVDNSAPNVWREKRSEEADEKEPWVLPPDTGAEELMPGIGIRDICVGLKYIFLPRIVIQQYEYAYKLRDDKLVLINGDRHYKEQSYRKSYSMPGRKEYDLHMLEELFVRRREVLHCGLSIDRDYPVIDCRKEKIRQVLTPEAYHMLCSQTMAEGDHDAFHVCTV